MGQMFDTCCGKCADHCECFLDTVPSVTLAAFIFSLVGLIYNMSCIDDAVNGLEQYGLDANKYSDEMLVVTFIIFSVDCLILFFALFSTGWCREKLFRESDSTCGFCAQVCFGPLCQTFFGTCLIIGIPLCFFCSVLSVIAYAIGLVGKSVCSGPLPYTYTATSNDWGNCNSSNATNDILINGQFLIGEIIDGADLPDLFVETKESNLVNASVICSSNENFKQACYDCSVGFTFLLVAQILFLTKVVHTLTCMRYDMTALSRKEDVEKGQHDEDDSKHGDCGSGNSPIQIELSAADLHKTNSLRVRNSRGEMIKVNINSKADVLQDDRSNRNRSMSRSERKLIKEHRKQKMSGERRSMKDVVNKLRIDNMRTKRELVQLRQEVSTTDTLKVKLQRAENELSRIRPGGPHAEGDEASLVEVYDEEKDRSDLYAVNFSTKTMAMYLSLCCHPERGTIELEDRFKNVLMSGRAIVEDEEENDAAASASARNADKERSTCAELQELECATFVMILSPRRALLPFRIESKEGTDAYHISHMAFPLVSHPDPTGLKQSIVPRFRSFPLATPKNEHAFLCTQGFGGRLSHFFPESYHAVDFRCDMGTPVLAVVDGTVTEICQENRDTGIHCQNLAKWNSISLRSVDGFTVDYVHIAALSAKVRVGQRVTAGSVLCLSGNVGFSPEPHLHLEVHMSSDPQGPSIRFEIAGAFESPTEKVESGTAPVVVSSFVAGMHYKGTNAAARSSLDRRR
eukprot:g4662.t1